MTVTLEAAIKIIIEKKPTKQANKQTDTIKIVKREKDIDTLRNLMSNVNMEVLDVFIEELPNRLLREIFYYYNSFSGIYEASAFHIYDPVLAKLVEQFKVRWQDTLNHGNMFFPSTSKFYSYHIPMDVFPNEQSELIYGQITKEVADLKIYLKELIVNIRENYFEVDIDALSKKAFENYKLDQQEAKKLLGHD